jgi:hypothetical protein
VICGRFFPVFWPVSSLIAVFDQAVYAILHALYEQAFSWRYGDGAGTVKKKRGTEQLQVVLQSTCHILLLALLLGSLFCLVPRPGDLLLLQEVLIQCNLREAILFFSLDKAASHDAWCSVLQQPYTFSRRVC